MKHVVIGTAGHIDHGKSALVHALTGTDPDRLKEEQQRGITIDLGFAHLQQDSVVLAFVDVPGHERFVKNMLAGVGGIDCVLLVVAADESVMPQTREHFEICRLLEIPRGVVALTKADLVDRETLELVRLEVRDLVAGSFLDQAAIVPVSVRTGIGLDSLRGALVAAAAQAPEQPAAGPVRLPVDRAFSMRGFGTVVTGTLVSGTLAVDATVEVLPERQRAKIRGLQVHGERRTEARAGQRTAANLAGIDWTDVHRGMVLAEPGVLEPTRIADATLELLASAKPLKERARVRFHQGTSEVLARISAIGPLGEAVIAPDRAVPVRFRFESPAVLMRGDRYIIRAYSPPVTIGGGRIIDPRPPTTGVRSAASAERARRMSGTVEDAVMTALVESAAAGLPEAELVGRFGLSRQEAERLVHNLVGKGLAKIVGAESQLVSVEVLNKLRASLRDAVADYHERHRHEEGMPREEAREKVFARALPSVFAHVVEELLRDGHIVGRDQLALTSHTVAVTAQEAAIRDRIETIVRQAGLTPPDPSALSAAAGAEEDVVARVIKALVRQRVLVRLESLIFHSQVLEALKQDVRRLKDSGARLDVATFKERYGVTRKYAIPLLEYLDRERVTRRVGDSRAVL